MSLLKIDSLSAGYGDLQVLTDIDMRVGRGEYVTIVGPNGAGKSTVMKSVFGLTNRMDGAVTFGETEITAMDPEEIIHEGVGYVPQTNNVFAPLSVRENLEMGAYILDAVPDRTIESVYGSQYYVSALHRRLGRCQEDSSRCLRWAGP